MKALFDGEIIEETIELDIKDRALQYGDGLFETIAIRSGQIKYLNYHLQRLERGANVLNIKIPAVDFEQQILGLIKTNNLSDASVKLMVWRKHSDAPGYNFSSVEGHYLLLSKMVSRRPPVVQQAGFAENIHFSHSPLSAIKTLNALPYILAANEKQQRQLDELIVLNNDGFICECVSSNIFWKKDGVFYTPPLSSGCLEGVVRRVLKERMIATGFSIEETLSTPNELLAADAVLTTNSSGIRFIKKIDSKLFDTSLADDSLFSI